MSTIALYYPWMRFRSEEWLKLAMLTWDQVGRIRPRLTMDTDSDLARQLRAETDFLFDLEPSEQDLDTVGELFGQIVELGGARLRGRFSVRAAVEAASPTPAATGLRARYPGLVWVYAGGAGRKMTQSLLLALVNAELAVVRDEDGVTHVGLHPFLARVYMTALADAVAANALLSPVTDDLDAYSAVGTLDRLYELLLEKGAARPAIGDLDHAYIHLAVEAVVRPTNIADVPVRKLIDFRERCTGELAAFRKHVGSLSEELAALAAIENPIAAHAHLHSVYRSTTQPQLDELRRAMRAFGVESSTGMLGLKVDLVSGTIIGGLAATAGQPVVAAAGVTLTVAPYVAGRIKARRLLREQSPVAYLLAVDQRLASRSLFKRR
ncbi:DUF6236 family protein [Nocardia sp. NBC_01503]|uniref:DUF6236 family protein n=1 Tax=Nocardia sp. NBC_01503 TaxID=2975997 RepID=UPI002E7ABBA7|nr:DUF6236 family protein [Nocardia sp. NBC_01503]WTL33142.1 DUF6236 family protein [Nocardia sp. NBC_01503]